MKTRDEIRSEIDNELKEIFEQPVVRKQKLVAIMSLIDSHTAEVERAARLDEVKKVYGDGTQHHFKVVEYLRKRIAELSPKPIEREQNGE